MTIIVSAGRGVCITTHSECITTHTILSQDRTMAGVRSAPVRTGLNVPATALRLFRKEKVHTILFSFSITFVVVAVSSVDSSLLTTNQSLVLLHNHLGYGWDVQRPVPARPATTSATTTNTGPICSIPSGQCVTNHHSNPSP